MIKKIKGNHPETDEEMNLEVHFEVEAFERQTFDCPGSDGGILIEKILHNGVDVTDLFDMSDIEETITDCLISDAEPPDRMTYDDPGYYDHLYEPRS